MDMMERKRIPERRKRYGWLVFLTAFSWLGLAAMILLVDPENVRDLIFPGSYFIFSVPAGTALFLLLTIVFLSARKAFWWTLGLLIFFYLRIYGLGSVLNGGLLLGIFVCGEIYARKGKAYTRNQTLIN